MNRYLRTAGNKAEQNTLLLSPMFAKVHYYFSENPVHFDVDAVKGVPGG